MSSHRSSAVMSDQSQAVDSTTHAARCHRAEVQWTSADNSENLQRMIISDTTTHANCDEQPVSDHVPVKLPDSEHFLTGLQLPSARPITELDGCFDAVDAGQLETEKTDFRDVAPRFQQNVAWPSSTQSSSAVFDGESHCNSQSAGNRCSNIYEQYKSAEVTEFSVNEQKDCVVDSNGAVPVSLAVSSAVSATDLSLSCVLRRINSLSLQLDAQAQKLSCLQYSVDQLSTVVAKSDHQFHFTSDPHVVYITTSDRRLRKAFLLDGRGRLRLDIVREAFGITSPLQIICNGQPCVVGADSDGYIPLRFSHGQAVEIVPSSVSSTDS